LCTGEAGVEVEILLSPFNYKHMERKYRAITPSSKLKIKPFYPKDAYLNAERMQKFMGSGESSKPLYMEVLKIFNRIRAC
jgi:hypothetical protein